MNACRYAVRIAELTFPNDEHSPTCALQSPSHPCIATFVGLALSLPKPGVGARRVFAGFAGVQMPEASMNENHGFLRPKYEIRSTRQKLVMKAKPKSESMRDASNLEFGRCVFATNRGHAARSLGWGEGVGHG